MYSNSLHSFFIYVFFGYFFIFPAVLLLLRLFAIRNPGQRLQLYLFALVTPLAGFLLYHTVLTKRCQIGLIPTGISGRLFDILCMLGNTVSQYLAPLLGVMVFMGVFKALAGILLVARIRSQATAAPADGNERVARIVTRQCAKLEIAPPEVMFSRRKGFAAFTAGFLRPVVVVNTRLTDRFDDCELTEILTHELVHIHRGDTMMGWFLHLVRDIMFFTPFSKYFLNRCLHEKERLCDLETVRITGQPHAYAATLLKVWRWLLEEQAFRPGYAAGFTGLRQDMALRVTGLLQEQDEDKKIPTPIFNSLLFIMFLLTMMYFGMIC